MRYLILLSAMLCFAEPFWIFGSFFGDSSFKYPFLRRASYEAVKAFNDIINNQQLTRAQRDAELERWAAQYNLVDGYRSYKNSTDKATSDRQQAIQKALDDLMKFFGDLHQLENNSSLTTKQEREEMQKLCSALDPPTRMVVNQILHIYDPAWSSVLSRYRRSSIFDDLFPPFKTNVASNSFNFRLW